MTTSGQLLCERRGQVLLLTLSDPPTRNALHPGIYQAGIEAIQQAQQDSGIGAIVLTGADGMFCSGGNLSRLISNRRQPQAVQYDSISLFHQWILTIRQCPKPVLAAVEGSAAGAGFSIVLACDLVAAAEDAQFVMAYVRVGLSPDGGASLLLARSLPTQLVSEILLCGQPIGAVRLHQLGMVNRLCPPGQTLAEALRWADRLAAGPPATMARIKRLVRDADGATLEQQLDRERTAFIESLYQPECGEGIAAFLARRPPRFDRDQT